MSVKHVYNDIVMTYRYITIVIVNISAIGLMSCIDRACTLRCVFIIKPDTVDHCGAQHRPTSSWNVFLCSRHHPNVRQQSL